MVAVPVALLLTIDQSVATSFRGAAPGLRDAMEFVTRFGESQWFLVPTGVAAIALFAVAGGEKRPLRRATVRWTAQANLFVFAVIAIAGIGVNVVKVIIGRARPRVFFGEGYFGAEPLTFGSAYASFPSGHTATACALAFAVTMVVPRLRLPLFAFAALIALSRVVVTAHWVGDTVAAAGLEIDAALKAGVRATKTANVFNPSGTCGVSRWFDLGTYSRP